ncbi:hypothetical protein [Flavobacterium sp.]|uniref:hypothetical protein n=1 Tax=Flavobacterium sp. TaxID=239 RepID=UPI004034244F
MKKLFAFFVLAAMFACTNDPNDANNTTPVIEQTLELAARITECPEGQHMALVYEFNTLRLHRGSTGCTRRFSICSDGKWEWQCVDNEFGAAPALDNSLTQARVVFEVKRSGTGMKIRFPRGLTSAAGFVASDLADFGFDSNFDMGSGVVIAAGDYPLTYTSTEIQVDVTLVP